LRPRHQAADDRIVRHALQRQQSDTLAASAAAAGGSGGARSGTKGFLRAPAAAAPRSTPAITGGGADRVPRAAIAGDGRAVDERLLLRVLDRPVADGMTSGPPAFGEVATLAAGAARMRA
jgi:hypothetical protein